MTEKTSEEPDFDKLLERLLEENRQVNGSPPAPKVEPRRKKPVGKMIVVAVSLSLILLATVWVYQDNSWRLSSQGGSGVPRAALLDQLSATVPDPSFNDSIRTTLVSAGYSLDYYSPALVTVQLLQSLPLKGYSLILIRSHSGSNAIYTSESYTTSRFVWEQLTNQIVPAEVNNQIYFAVTANFISESMHGTFPGSLIVVMGCSGLYDSGMATAFLAKGAKDVVGWSGAVNAAHTDTTTATLVQYLSQGKSVKEAVDLTSAKVGPDPVYGAHLSYYDFKVGFFQEIQTQLLGLASILVVVAAVVLGPLIILLIPKLVSRR